jgi:lysophospholipase L1-like esterase
MQSIPQWAAVALLLVVALATLITLFAWGWAVRRPREAARVGVTEQERAGMETKVPMVFVAIGASDVVGMGADDPERDNWATVLHSYMPTGTRLVRLARPGITLREANASEVFQAVRARPNLITLWNCVNDLTKRIPLGDYTRELEIALSRLTRETEARIVVLNVPDLSRLLPATLGEAQRTLVRGGIVQWNGAIAKATARYGSRVRVLDLFAKSEEMMSQRDNVATDGFHLSTAGHRALAELVWEEIRTANVMRET